MNDPGLDDPIQNGAKTVEQDKDEEFDLLEQEEQAFLNPRWVVSRIMLLYIRLQLFLVAGGLLLRHFHSSLFVQPIYITLHFR